jgi:hypothetical protein
MDGIILWYAGNIVQNRSKTKLVFWSETWALSKKGVEKLRDQQIKSLGPFVNSSGSVH